MQIKAAVFSSCMAFHQTENYCARQRSEREPVLQNSPEYQPVYHKPKCHCTYHNICVNTDYSKKSQQVLPLTELLLLVNFVKTMREKTKQIYKITTQYSPYNGYKKHAKHNLENKHLSCI